MLFLKLALKGTPGLVAPFRVQPYYVLLKPDGGRDRLVRLINIRREISRVVALDENSFTAARDWRRWLARIGNYGWEKGDGPLQALQRDINFILARREVIQLVCYGCERPGALWFSDDCAYADNGTVLLPDGEGIFWHQGRGYTFLRDQENIPRGEEGQSFRLKSAPRKSAVMHQLLECCEKPEDLLAPGGAFNRPRKRLVERIEMAATRMISEDCMDAAAAVGFKAYDKTRQSAGVQLARVARTVELPVYLDLTRLSVGGHASRVKIPVSAFAGEPSPVLASLCLASRRVLSRVQRLQPGGEGVIQLPANLLVHCVHRLRAVNHHDKFLATEQVNDRLGLGMVFLEPFLDGVGIVVRARHKPATTNVASVRDLGAMGDQVEIQPAL